VLAVFTELPSLSYHLKTISTHGMEKKLVGILWDHLTISLSDCLSNLPYQNYQVLKLFNV
jgi:hypothetical protein